MTATNKSVDLHLKSQVYSKIDKLLRDIPYIPIVKNNKKIEYLNIPVAFDIETTSFIQSNGHKGAIMYIWTLSINGLVIQGRSWKEFINCLKFIQHKYSLNEYCRMIIFVHNLSFEFQFMHKWFKFLKVFSLKERQPISALTTMGIEFRCSYKLSGYSLAKLSDQLTKYKVKKLVGDLDYSLIRNNKTKLTAKENDYCINDVQVIVAYIKEYIERVDYIYEIPLTKTGAVRKLARNYCYYNNESKKKNFETYSAYRKLMDNLTLNVDTYSMLKSTFMGGFTHANSLYVGDIMVNVHSFDFTSSYPYVMVSEEFPMSEPQKVTVQSTGQFNEYLDNYCCMFELELFNVKPKVIYENYISKSHCSICEEAVVNNGRVVSAKRLKISVTELDYFIIKAFYDYTDANIYNMYIMRKHYLPTNYVKCVLDQYEKKTQLKDVSGKEVEYLVSKENVNSLYGMMVTDICRDEIEYSPVEWTKKDKDMQELIDKNNRSVKRFLYYAWGVWVTAYARFNLFTGIKELGIDYVYSDTDSVKFINYDKHKSYFEEYNKSVIYKLKHAMKFHGIPFERTCPKTIKGEVKQLGIWDEEPTYDKFKTLGAKRYMTQIGDKISITVSGLNKHETVPYLLKTYGDKIFEEFKEGLYIPPENTGKNTHTYIDEEINGVIIDYQGNKSQYHEKSCIHLGPAEYSLSLSKDFINFLLDIQSEEEDL